MDLMSAWIEKEVYFFSLMNFNDWMIYLHLTEAYSPPPLMHAPGTAGFPLSVELAFLSIDQEEMLNLLFTCTLCNGLDIPLKFTL